MDDSAEAWLNRVEVDMPHQSIAITTGGSTSKIHKRNVVVVGGRPDTCPGAVDTY